jgi:GDSL-like Lipase/Acylhydrolase family
VDVGVAWWLFASAAGAFSRWLFLIVALAAIALGAWSAWRPVPVPYLRRTRVPHPSLQPKPIWPKHTRPGPAEWGTFTPLLILLGGTVGVVVAVAYLGISAWHENVDVPPAHPLPSALEGIHGSYVALGDSYSSGEGLPPFAPGAAATNCDRSVSSAYPDLLFKLLRKQDNQASLTFTACAGALVSQILGPTYRPGGLVPPEINGSVQPSVGLVTLTIGGDNAIFSSVVENCLISGNCLDEVFPPAGVGEATAKHVPQGELKTQWGPGTIEEIGAEDAVLFRALRRDFPNARIIVIGYPYLFPDIPAPGFPYIHPMCSSILNRLSQTERKGIRALQDEFDNRVYEEAVAAGIEFVSPRAIWSNHEPCGSSGQYTNSVKPYLNFPDPINGGSFHPNAAGHRRSQPWWHAIWMCIVNLQILLRRALRMPSRFHHRNS